MAGRHLSVGDRVVIERKDLGLLVEALAGGGSRVIGPTVRDRAIVYDDITGADDLPIGWTDEQDGGTYRLKRRDDASVFGHVVGPCSWKNFLYPSVVRLWKARRETPGFRILPGDDAPQPMAFLGVRSCDLHAITIQDRVLIEGEYADPVYRARRESVFIVAVNCTEAHGTCFCTSMNTGPRATSGFDVALTEILEDTRHVFVAETGSEKGCAFLGTLPHRPAQPDDLQTAERLVAEAAGAMGRTMDTAGIKELLYANYDHPRWLEVAERCLTCGNCTMVCPTCFCTTQVDLTDLSGEFAERWRRLDSCFTLDFSYIHGGSVRSSPCSRYRQWMVHKLAAWIDQFGSSGCVGCGRCITWCPVGIDITEEVRAIRSDGRATAAAPSGERIDADA